MHEKIEYRCELVLGKENGEALEDFEEYLKRRRERRERNDDDSDDDNDDDSDDDSDDDDDDDNDDDNDDDDDDDSDGWDSERKKFRMPGEFMAIINSYIDEAKQRQRGRGRGI
jgi:hypothetical protein